MSFPISPAKRAFALAGKSRLLTVHLFVRLLVDGIIVNWRYGGIVLFGVSSATSATSASTPSLRRSIPSTSSSSSRRAVEKVAKGLSWHFVEQAWIR